MALPHRNTLKFVRIAMETVPVSRARPSMFLTCRLASIVQKFKTRLQEKVSQKKRTLSPFGASYYRGTRLRALSDLEKYILYSVSSFFCRYADQPLLVECNFLDVVKQ